ncbi:MAG: signal recognition particle-docking protein FtsY, partial [Chloroflexi bacterium]
MFRRSKKIRDSLTKTRRSFFGQISSLLGGGQITEETWEDLEALLVQADVGVETTVALVDRLREQVSRGKARTARELEELLKKELLALLGSPPPMKVDEDRLLTLILVVGVNGSGKTTTIAKLARYYKERGRRVLLAAADTFRAAAIDQLKIWGGRSGASVIARAPGADAAGLAFDALTEARGEEIDVLLIDTAGRLQNKAVLMDELEKMVRVLKKV